VPPTNYVLIDFENVQPQNLEILQKHPFNIIVFVGENQVRIPFEMASALQRYHWKSFPLRSIRTRRYEPSKSITIINNESKSMAWVYLVMAGVFECAWAIGLKYAENFTKLVPSLLTILAMGISIWLLSVAMKTIPVGTAYAVWTGIGAVGVAILGMFLFGESRDTMRVICLLLIVSGIVGLKLVSS
jgi:quaternary ammonium compound-resistance protein SugE